MVLGRTWLNTLVTSNNRTIIKIPIKDSCKLLFHAWYLDDGTIIGDAKEVAKALDVIIAEGPRLGFQLNIKKTEVFLPSCDGVKVQDGLFPSEIGRPGLGVKLLGGAVSRDAGFISNLAMIRASRAVELMRCLPHLRDPQRTLPHHLQPTYT